MISELTGIPRATVHDWRLGLHSNRRRTDVACEHDPEDLDPEQYAYLLGMHLGDGCISAHPRGVFRLRIACDSKYPEIIAAVGVRDGIGPRPRTRKRCAEGRPLVEVNLYWKHWPCLFPQHKPGLKWQRPIVLAGWQEAIVEREREAFVRGLIDSDGCRITARYREKSGKERRYGRYVFSNRNEDIHRLFTDSLDALDVHWTRANFKDVAVARQRDVWKMDNFIGPKA